MKALIYYILCCNENKFELKREQFMDIANDIHE